MKLPRFISRLRHSRQKRITEMTIHAVARRGRACAGGRGAMTGGGTRTGSEAGVRGGGFRPSDVLFSSMQLTLSQTRLNGKLPIRP